MDTGSIRFWLEQWDKIREQDSCSVHKGFASRDYWDRAARSYDQDPAEKGSRGVEKAIDLFRRNRALEPGMTVLDIGCGTGRLAAELASHGLSVTAIDFSEGMLDEARRRLPSSLRGDVTFLLQDWNQVDLKANGWENAFDLVIAFMAPAVATPAALNRLMAASRFACAIKGWAAKRNHPILDALWQAIMGQALADRPQSLIIKINLLMAMGYFPEIYFDPVVWSRNVPMEEEIEKRLAFFKTVSSRSEDDLRNIIQQTLQPFLSRGRLVHEQAGMTGTVFWRLDPEAF